jgi:hypothetical protein
MCDFFVSFKQALAFLSNKTLQLKLCLKKWNKYVWHTVEPSPLRVLRNIWMTTRKHCFLLFPVDGDRKKERGGHSSVFSDDRNQFDRIVNFAEKVLQTFLLNSLDFVIVHIIRLIMLPSNNNYSYL